MFRMITLPQLRTTSTAVLLLLLIAAFQAFDEFYNLTGNNPETRPPLVYLYNIALGPQQDFGRGSAGALVLTAIMVIAGLLQTWLVGFGSDDDRRGGRFGFLRRLLSRPVGAPEDPAVLGAAGTAATAPSADAPPTASPSTAASPAEDPVPSDPQEGTR
jgi:multiple sugar transport system permease protein